MLLFALLACAGDGAPPPSDTGDSGDSGAADAESDTADTADTAEGDTACVPGEEACNGVDDDCDGVEDEADAVGCEDRWLDVDRDGAGTGDPACLCRSEGDHVALHGGDCDDADSWRAEECSTPTEIAETAVIVGEIDSLSLGDGSLSASGTLAGTGAWLYVPTDEEGLVVAVPDGGQVGAGAITVATVAVRVAGVGDLDGDGVDDLATSYASRVDYASSYPDLDIYEYFYNVGMVSGPVAGAVSHDDAAFEVETPCSGSGAGVRVADDFDADGRADVVNSGWCDGDLRRWTTGGWETLVAGYVGSVGDVGDADGDGFDDLLVEELLFYGPDPGGWTAADADVVLESAAASAGDLDGDGDPDFFVTDGVTTWILDELDEGRVEDLAVATIGADDYHEACPVVHALGDLDGDGADDLALPYEGLSVLFGPLNGRLALANADVHVSAPAGQYSFGENTARVEPPDGVRVAVAAEDVDLGAPNGGAVYVYDFGEL